MTLCCEAPKLLWNWRYAISNQRDGIGLLEVHDVRCESCGAKFWIAGELSARAELQLIKECVH